MSDVRLESRKPSRPYVAEPVPGARESKLSLYFLLWMLAAPLVGFALAGRVFGLGAAGDWELWKAAVIGALMMGPFAVGAYFGLRAVLKRYFRGWVGFVSNLILGMLAISMPMWEAVTG